MRRQEQDMRMWSKRMLMVVLMSLACQLAPRGGAAAPIVLDFEGVGAMNYLPYGVPIPSAARLASQFLSTVGVQFRSGSPYVAVVALGVGHATSGVNGLAGSTATGLLTYDGSAPLVASFFDPTAPLIAATTDFVSVRLDLQGTSGLSVTLRAFDVHGALLAAVTSPDVGGATLHVAMPGIHSVQYVGTVSFNGAAIDDFAFNPVTPVVTAVPEPSTCLLIGTGVVLALGRRRRTRQ